MSRGGWMASHTLDGTCPICDEQLGDERLIRRKGVWIHRACQLRETGE